MKYEGRTERQKKYHTFSLLSAENSSVINPGEINVWSKEADESFNVYACLFLLCKASWLH